MDKQCIYHVMQYKHLDHPGGGVFQSESTFGNKEDAIYRLRELNDESAYIKTVEV